MEESSGLCILNFKFNFDALSSITITPKAIANIGLEAECFLGAKFNFLSLELTGCDEVGLKNVNGAVFSENTLVLEDTGTRGAPLSPADLASVAQKGNVYIRGEVSELFSNKYPEVFKDTVILNFYGRVNARAFYPTDSKIKPNFSKLTDLTIQDVVEHAAFAFCDFPELTTLTLSEWRPQGHSIFEGCNFPKLHTINIDYDVKVLPVIFKNAIFGVAVTVFGQSVHDLIIANSGGTLVAPGVTFNQEEYSWTAKSIKKS